MRVYEGKLSSQQMRVGIVVARFNAFITTKLLDGALDGLHRHDVQAIERAGTKAGNKGFDCAMSAIEMVNVIRELEA